MKKNYSSLLVGPKVMEEIIKGNQRAIQHKATASWLSFLRKKPENIRFYETVHGVSTIRRVIKIQKTTQLREPIIRILFV